VRHLVELALEEDVGRGDATADALWGPAAAAASLMERSSEPTVKAVLLAKQPLVVCGLPVAREVFEQTDPAIALSLDVPDGREVVTGTLLAALTGPVRSVLAAERTALNFLQRMSGVSTLTRRFVRAVAGSGASIVDTRKTLPGWRRLDKYAVSIGGGGNHRADLGSGLLLKDNHIRACGSIGAAVAQLRRGAPHPLRIEVEVTTLEELQEALRADVELVLLDNMDDAQVAAAVAVVRGRDRDVKVEVSGGVDLDRAATLARLGVDLISVGRLTHSAPAVDISLEILAP
jgi:nicotinate-nucleotide pyrophosphorylase (carboxylating)